LLPAVALVLACGACGSRGPSGSANSAPGSLEEDGAEGADELTEAAVEEGEGGGAGAGSGAAGDQESGGRASGEGASAAGPPILVAHNRFRGEHCAAPLAWSRELADSAERWVKTLVAKGCGFDHDPNTRHGENLAYFRPAGSRSPEQVAALWHSEGQRYNFRRAQFSFDTGHFTQLVWAASQKLGCASATCDGGTLWVCRYDPPGNMQGAFAANVKPITCKK
jgi:hypothetical protein